jgi:hypothetical protein
MALAKTGNADNATIISFTSPSLPDRLAAILPGVSTTHVLLEDLEKGPQQLSQKSILLSVLQWLSPSRTAQLINNLSLSVPEGAEVIFTYPPTHLINPRALAELQVAGFALLRAGELCLLPEGIGDPEAQKLEQVSRLGILRRIGVGSAASEIDLFITPETAVSIGDGSNSKGATYTQADLGRAKASVVSYGVGAVVVKENVPLVVSVEAGTVDMSSKADGAVDKGILTFLDGTIAGFNMDEKKPGNVELEGRRISQSTVNAVSAISLGKKPAGVIVPKDIAGKYADFLNHVSISGDLAVRQVRPNGRKQKA